MNKKQMYIIISVISVLVILILFLITIIVKISKDDSKPKIKGIGVYHNNNWNSNEATLILNDDMTCKYPSSSHDCKWELSDKQIIITLRYYAIINDNKEIPTLGSYNSKTKCEEDIKKYEGVYNLTNPDCEGIKDIHKAILGESSVILHEHLFNKVG